MSIAAVERCLDLIEALAHKPEGASISELSASLNLPLSAVHRMLSTLTSRGYVRQDPPTHAYMLSLRFAALGFRLLDAQHLPDIAQLTLAELARETGEYCRLAVVQDRELVWVAHAQGATQGLRYEPPMGQDIVLHATATGKAWLATLPETEALEIVYERGFPTPRRTNGHSFGRNVVTTIDALRTQLAETRARGYALAVEEGEPGTVAMAVTFRNSDALGPPVLGVLSVAGPMVRLTPERHPQIAENLMQAAEELSALWPARQRQFPDMSRPTAQLAAEMRAS